MKIPGANPAREVQSLGRRDIYGPMRVANAEARAARYEGVALRALGALATDVGKYIGEKADQKAVLEYNTALTDAQTQLDGLTGRLNQPTLEVAKTPGLDAIDWQRDETVRDAAGQPTTRPRAVVPTDEVAVDLFEAQSRGIYETAMANLTSKRARRKFQSDWTKAHQAALLKVTTGAMKQRRTRTGIELETRIDTLIQQGLYVEAHAAHAQGVATGIFSLERATSMRRRIDSRIAERSAIVALAEANTEDAIEEVQQLLLATPQLDPEDQQKLLNAADSKLARLRSESERRASEAADNVVSQSLEQHLTEGLTWAEVQDRTRQLRLMGEGDKATRLLQNYDAVRRRFMEEANETPPEQLSRWQALIGEVAFPPEGESIAAMGAQVRRDLLDAVGSGSLDAGSYRTLMQSLEDTMAISYNQEAYRATKRAIWVDVGGMSEQEFTLAIAQAAQRGDVQGAAAYTQLSQVRVLAQRAEDDLRAYIEATGVDADIPGWWARNQSNYDATEWVTRRHESFLRQHPAYADVVPEGVDPASEEGMNAVRRAISEDTSIGPRERNRRWEIYQGLPR